MLRRKGGLDQGGDGADEEGIGEAAARRDDVEEGTRVSIHDCRPNKHATPQPGCCRGRPRLEYKGQHEKHDIEARQQLENGHHGGTQALAALARLTATRRLVCGGAGWRGGCRGAAPRDGRDEEKGSCAAGGDDEED